MKKVFSMSTCFLIAGVLFFNASLAQLSAPPDGGNKKAFVGERVGITDVMIHYDRPHVNGREGKIWGQLIPAGYVYQGFGNSKEAPWRAGANENTTIEFSTDVKIEGQDLPAGKYGFFIAYDPGECTVIFSRNSSSWGSFFYTPKEDVLRVKVKPIAADKSLEWLKYEFADETDSSAVVKLQWEKLIIPVKISVELNNVQLESFRKELRSDKGFNWENWRQAAQWCVDQNTNLDQALLWSDSATSINFGGDQSFQSWSTKSQVLVKLGRQAEASEIIKKALPFGNLYDLHQYGIQLHAQKKDKEAFDVYKLNLDKHPSEYIAVLDLARGYSALGNYKKALEFAQKAGTLTQEPRRKANIEKMIKLLQDGKDMNS
jgi:hypothetical protein